MISATTARSASQGPSRLSSGTAGASRDEARLAAFRHGEGFHNPHRRHSALDHRSPAEYEEMLRDGEAVLAKAVQREGVIERRATQHPGDALECAEQRIDRRLS